MVEYYDDRRKALIKITYGKKKPNSAKKRQYKNSKLNQFGSAQRDALNKMVFIRSMATKDPQFAPLDMQDRIISARKEQLELQKQIAGLTLASQALNRNDDKEFAKVLTSDSSTETDFIPPPIGVPDLLAADRQSIGDVVFDKLVITHTRQERLKALGRTFPEYNIFVADRASQNLIDNLYTSLDSKRLPTPKRGRNNIDNIYKYFTEQYGRNLIGGDDAPSYMRTSYELPRESITTQMQRGVEQVYTPLGEASGTDVYEEFQSAKEDFSEVEEIPVGEPRPPLAPVVQPFGGGTSRELPPDMPPPPPRSPRRKSKGKSRQN